MTIPLNHRYKHNGIPLNDDSILWRYMDFPKFASLLMKGGLFFSRLDRMKDPYEGLLTRRDYEYSKSLSSENDQMDNKDTEQWMQNTQRSFFVNCWHKNDGESAAMWSLYGQRGQSITVTTKYGNIIECCPPFISVAPVDYIDPDTDSHYFKNNLGLHMLAVWKRPSYQHEREVRLFFHKMDLTIVSPGVLTGAKDGTGFTVQVDLKSIISEIYVDPKSDPWFFELVKDFAAQYGMKDRVMPSKLMQPPDYI